MVQGGGWDAHYLRSYARNLGYFIKLRIDMELSLLELLPRSLTRLSDGRGFLGQWKSLIESFSEIFFLVRLPTSQNLS